MIAIAPLMRGRPMFRTWLALTLASIGAWLVNDIAAYIVIDLLAASIVVARPSSLPQKLIGALFICMVLFDIGYYLSPRADGELFLSVLTAIGWFQWFVLVGWAGHGAWRRYIHWSDPAGSVFATNQRRV